MTAEEELAKALTDAGVNSDIDYGHAIQTIRDYIPNSCSISWEPEGSGSHGLTAFTITQSGAQMTFTVGPEGVAA